MDFERAVSGLLARGRGRMVPDLSRITALTELLGEPQRTYRSVHVTGTNGKTSIARMVTALCSAVGLSAGTYISPHLQVVRERLAVAGRMIGEQAFADLYEDVAPLAELIDEDREQGDHVTYFELLTAMAYWWFAQQAVEVGVFEVGMGGRWDATNLVDGTVAVLGPVDVDHPELGGDPAEVAEEKLGIVKDGSVLVSARQQPGVMRRVREVAADRARDLLVAGDDLEVVDREVTPGGQQLAIRVRDRVVDDLALPLVGRHQADNAALALGALAGLTGSSFDDVDDDLLRRGLQFVSVPGRLEVVDREPTVLLDGAHNPHGAATSAAAVTEAYDFRTVVLVVGCLSDKDHEGILEAYREVADHVVVTVPPSPRAARLDQLRSVAEDVWSDTGVIVEAAGTVDGALGAATGLTVPADAVLVTGSLYTVGAVRDRYLPITDTGDEVIYEPEDVDDEEDEAAFNEALSRMIEQLGEEEAGPPGEG